MKPLIICVSVHHQNTLKIAQILAKILKAKIVKPEEIKFKDLKNYDLIGFGSGIYFGQFHKNLLTFIDSLPEDKYLKAFVFSTSGAGLKFYNQSLIKKLEQKGFQVVGDFTCRGFDTYGPYKLLGGLAKGRPNEKDFEAAENFAKELKNKLMFFFINQLV